MSQRTVWRIAHEDLGGILRRKWKVHALSHTQVAQRVERGSRFLRYLEGAKFKKLVSVDECWVYLTTANGQRRIYYEFKGEKTEESWRKFWEVSHQKSVMCFTGVSYWGKTELRFVEPKAKINADYYIEHLLKPLCEKDIPEMFRGRRIKPVLHQDNAPAHAARKTQEWLQNCGIDFIPKEMSKAPDCAIMDFCVNGLFKWELFDRQPTTIDGLKRVATEMWHNLDQVKIQNAFKSWYGRGGYQIEHILKQKRRLENKEN